MKQHINTREDLDAISGTPEHAKFMDWLRGTMKRMEDRAAYPENYDNTLRPGDHGYVAPDWQEVEDLTVIERFNFSKEDFA